MIGDNYIFIEAKDIPDKFESKTVYHFSDDKVIALICHCGCGALIQLNELDDTRPRWKIINGNTIHPSINRIVGCKSHFSIINGKVQ
jgi:hypothetical protein